MSRLEASGLACTRGFATLFRDVSFDVRAGEWLSLRGPNGSGKTTLLRCVAGLTRADAGEIRWNGATTSDTDSDFRTHLLYSGHLPALKDELTAEENLHTALGLRGVEADEGAVRGALAEAGLERRRQLPARRLSAGQRRRIGLARLALDPARVWALDEPLTALDDEGQQLFARLLERHLAGGGLAVVATHHDLTATPTRTLRLGA